MTDRTSPTMDLPRRIRMARPHRKAAASRCLTVDRPMEMAPPRTMPATVPAVPRRRGRLALRRVARRLLPLAGLLLATSTFNRSYATPSDSAVCESEMTRAARKYDVPLGVLYAVALTETGNRGSLHPFALNIEGASYFS